MKLYLEAVPFNSSRLVRWLEGHLVSDHLGELIEELLAVRPPPSVLNFEVWFAPFEDQILSGGLSGVPRAALRQLLAYPPALRKLQRAVLLGGGRYWDQVPRSKGFRHRLADNRPAASTPPQPTSTPLPANHRPTRPVPPEPIPLAVATPTDEPIPLARRHMPVWAVILAVVATVVISGLAVWLALVLTSPFG